MRISSTTRVEAELHFARHRRAHGGNHRTLRLSKNRAPTHLLETAVFPLPIGVEINKAMPFAFWGRAPSGREGFSVPCGDMHNGKKTTALLPHVNISGGASNIPLPLCYCAKAQKHLH